MRWLGIGILAVLLVFVIPRCASSSPSAATTQESPSPQITLGPIGALLAYNEAMLRGDKSLLKTRTHSVTERGRQVQEAYTSVDAAVGKVLKLANKQLGEKSACQIGQLLGDSGKDDLADAQEAIDGDHAEVSRRGNEIKTPMIRIDGLWRMDYDKIAALFSEPGQLDREIESTEINRQTAEALGKALLNDEVKCVDDARKIIQSTRLGK